MKLQRVCGLVLSLAAVCLTGCDPAAALFDAIEHLVYPSGNLDPTFGGGDGIVTTDLLTSWDEAYTMALQADGKIILAGRCASGIAIARYASQGALDTTFGGGVGFVKTNLGGAASARAAAIQSDGKIVVVGTTNDTAPSDIVVLRYTSSGDLDTSFSGDGIAIADLGSNERALSVAIQSDGMIVVAGFSDADFVVLRYDDLDGSLDSGFATAGVARTNLGGSSAYAKSVAIQPTDQRIVAVGDYWTGSERAFAAVRYNTNGSLDSTFDGDGIAVANVVSSVDESGNCVALQTDGKIVIGGHSHTATRFALARLNADGSLETSFGSSGFAITPYENSSMGQAVAIQTDGRIVLAGSTFDGTDNMASVVRYMPDGSLDSSFGVSSSGISTFRVQGDNLYGQAVAIQGDGRILIAGYSTVGNNFALLRILP